MKPEHTEDSPRFRDRLVGVEPLAAESEEGIAKELHAVFVRQLTTRRRIVYGVVATVAIGSATVCGFLAATERDLPPLPRIALGVGSLFGVAWTAVATRAARRGVVDLQFDGRRMATMAWGFAVLAMAFFLLAGMSLEDRMLGLMMILNGLALLIGAAVYWLTFRIDLAARQARERLLQLELRIADWCERH